jgi:hypothetical protein
MNFGAEGHSRPAETIMQVLARILPYRMWPHSIALCTLLDKAG